MVFITARESKLEKPHNKELFQVVLKLSGQAACPNTIHQGGKKTEKNENNHILVILNYFQ